jgi:hypothetical protein
MLLLSTLALLLLFLLFALDRTAQRYVVVVVWGHRAGLRSRSLDGLCGGLLLCLLAPRSDHAGQLLEELLYIASCLGRNLHIGQTQLCYLA